MKRKLIPALLLAAAVLCFFAGCDSRSTLTDLTAVTIATEPEKSEKSKSDASSKAASAVEPTEPATQAAPKGEAVEASWFNDSVFLGDSVTLGLSYYCDDNPDALGDAQFFCAGSLGFTNALWDLDAEDNVHPYYQGANHLSRDCAAVTGAKKVFIMLGMNDIGLYGVDESMESARTLISQIAQTSPGVTFYIQSVTPMIAEKEGVDLKNEYIRDFNTLLKSYCSDNGYKYLDVYNLVADSEGNLKAEYCGDPEVQGIHFTDAACEIWTDYLKENVK